jgi:hypothetical protein
MAATKTIFIDTPELSQNIEVTFRGGYTVKMTVQARVGDITSVYVTPPVGETVHLASA